MKNQNPNLVLQNGDQLKLFSLLISMVSTCKGDHLDAYWSTDDVINTLFFQEILNGKRQIHEHTCQLAF